MKITQKQKVLVIGLGISGQSATTFLEKKGYRVVGFDDKTCKNPIEKLEEFSFIVLSPGVPLSHPLCVYAKSMGIPMKGEAQLALESVTQPCIGVTGSNGKTTVVKMIEHCLNHFGKKALAVGNVGNALTHFVGGEEILVVELSSFQLETLSAKVFDVGILLNITENHLDRYPSMYEYGKAKARLGSCVKEGGKFFAHAEIDSKFFSSPYLPYMGENEKAVQLVCACFGMDEKQFIQAASSFAKPLHRIEFVAEVKGVTCYNDSKATTVAAVHYALDTLQKRVILLLGGQDKGISFAPLNARQEIVCVIAFGLAREKIANALSSHEVQKVTTLKEAVELALSIAKTGDTILLSPGCASYDAFKNFEERGEEFKRLVRERLGGRFV